MRILRVIAGSDLRSGGPIEGVRLSVLRHLHAGHEVELATLDAPDAGHLGAFPAPVHALGSGQRKYGFSAKFSRWIADNAGRFDVAVLHGLWNYSSFGAWTALRRTGTPYVIYTHGMLDPWFNTVQAVKRWAKQIYWLLAEGRVLADARAVLFTTDEERQRARTAFWGHRYTERVVAYGAGDPPVAAVDAEIWFRGLLPHLADREYLLFMGRLHPKKGVDHLLRAFAEVASEAPQLHLVVAGPDQAGLRAELEEFVAARGIGDRVHFPGMLEGEAKWGALVGAAAFVLPSHQENFGIAVAEALASGVPVLISDKVNIWREVISAGAGVVESDTLAGTVNLLQRFLALPAAERERMAVMARRAYERHFSADEAANDLLQVLEEVVAERRGSPDLPQRLAEVRQ